MLTLSCMNLFNHLGMIFKIFVSAFKQAKNNVQFF